METKRILWLYRGFIGMMETKLATTTLFRVSGFASAARALAARALEPL